MFSWKNICLGGKLFLLGSVVSFPLALKIVTCYKTKKSAKPGKS